LVAGREEDCVRDYTGSDAALMAVDVKTGQVAKVTSPGQLGPDKWVAWR
jgi:hypothetical protein